MQNKKNKKKTHFCRNISFILCLSLKKTKSEMLCDKNCAFFFVLYYTKLN